MASFLHFPQDFLIHVFPVPANEGLLLSVFYQQGAQMVIFAQDLLRLCRSSNLLHVLANLNSPGSARGKDQRMNVHSAHKLFKSLFKTTYKNSWGNF